jgi:uncharacterized protein
VFWLMITLVVLLACDLAVRIFYVRLILRIFETKPPFAVHLFPPDPDAETIEFTTSDGLRLRGSLYRKPQQTPKGLILFCPETDGSHWSAMSYCHALIESGFCVMSFDFRGQGESDPFPGYIPNHWPTIHEVEDVRAAIEFISTREDLRSLPLGLMGVSRGSSLALIAAAESPSVRAVCCEGAYSTDSLMLYFILRWSTVYVPNWIRVLIPRWHYRVTSILVRWTSQILRHRKYVVLEKWLPMLRNRPVLLVTGERDNYVHPDVARELIRCIRSSEAQLWQVPSAKHNRARAVAAAEYDRRLTDFFSQIQAPIAAS